jgi:hypothetical protein
MSGQIFISYRREDSAAWAGRLYDRLSSRFASDKIFMDVVDLAPGVDFVEVLEESVGACDVLIAVIGRRWMSGSDEAGKRRLDKPEDFVRIELATALKRGIRVIPVLVDGAVMPQSGELPEDLKALARRHALEASHTRFSADAERLIIAVEEVLERVRVDTQRKREQQERVVAEQRQLEEKERLEAERRQKEAQDRLQAEREAREWQQAGRRQQEQRERLQAEQGEKERLEAQRHEREEQERLEAERLDTERRKRSETLAEAREERKELDSQPHKGSGEERREPLASAVPESKPQGEAEAIRPAVRPLVRLRFVQKWSFVPFALLLLALLFPLTLTGGSNACVYNQFWYWITHPEVINSGALSFMEAGFVLIVPFACPLLVPFLHFLKYRGKALVEAALSWIGALFFTFLLVVAMSERDLGPGLILAWCLLAGGTAMKTIVAAQSRKLNRV